MIPGPPIGFEGPITKEETKEFFGRLLSLTEAAAKVQAPDLRATGLDGNVRMALRLASEAANAALLLYRGRDPEAKTELVKKVDRALAQLTGSPIARRRARAVVSLWDLAARADLGAHEYYEPIAQAQDTYFLSAHPPAAQVKACAVAVKEWRAYFNGRRGGRPIAETNSFLKLVGLGSDSDASIRKFVEKLEADRAQDGDEDGSDE